MTDKLARKSAAHAWKAQQRVHAREKLPLAAERLKALFDALDIELPKRGCDHTLRFVQEWCRRTDADFAPLCAWLNDNGGFCDCEVLANCEEVFAEAMR
ncbi:MAG TPA: DUF2695 domain-containing protein [Planctomycetota bacterium]|nr:DUF2695 domain-containing protein [Planctomycetota bacterium]